MEYGNFFIVIYKNTLYVTQFYVEETLIVWPKYEILVMIDYLKFLKGVVQTPYMSKKV